MPKIVSELRVPLSKKSTYLSRNTSFFSDIQVQKADGTALVIS